MQYDVATQQKRPTMKVLCPAVDGTFRCGNGRKLHERHA